MARNPIVTFEDGSTHQYNNVPDNVTPQQIQQRAQQDFGKQVVNIDGGRETATQETTEATGLPMGSVNTGDIKSGFLMGIKDPLTAGAQMLPRGLEILTSAGGAYPNVVSKFFADEVSRVDALAAEEEQKYQAQRAAQGDEGFDPGRMTGNIINPANLAVGLRGAQVFKNAPMATAALTGAGTTMLTPVTDMSEESFGEQKLKQGGVGAIAGPAGNLAVKGVGRVISPLRSQAEETMRQLGVTLTPGQLMGKQTKAIEEFAQNIPLVGTFISGARERQLFQFNKGVLNNTLRKVDEKLPDDVIGRDAVAYVQQTVGQKYDEVLNNVSMKYDRGLAAKIGDVIAESKIAGAAKKQELSDLLDNLIYSQVPVDRNIVGEVSGTAFKNIETNINRKIAQYSRSTDPNDLEIADALNRALKTWRLEMMSQNPKQAQKLLKINAAYADLTAIETAAAAGSATNGVFTPKNYQAAVRQRDLSRRKRAFAAGKARGQQVSDAAVDLLSPEIASTTEGRVAMGLAGGYGALQNPIVAGAAVVATPILYSKGGLRAIEAIASRRPDIARKIGDALQKLGPKEGSITAAQVVKEYQRATGEMPFAGE